MSEKDRAAAGSVVAGIDIGGTFTDLILVDGRDGKVRIAKTPTTVDNQAHGVMSALAATGFPVEAIDLIVHGTTTTTNAVLERRLARDRHDHHARLPRHHRARPPHPAAALRHDRRLRAGDPAQSAGSRFPSASRRRARCARRSTRTRFARRSAAWSKPAANRWSSISCIPTPTRRMSAAPPRSPPRPGRTATSPWAMRCCRRRANSSAASRLRSTPRCGRSSSAMSSGCAPNSPGAATCATSSS